MADIEQVKEALSSKVIRGFAGDYYTWGTISNASGYTIELTAPDGTITTATAQATDTQYPLDLIDFDTKLRIKANGSGRYTDSQWSTQVTYTAI